MIFFCFTEKNATTLGEHFSVCPQHTLGSGRVPMKKEDLQISLASQKKERLVLHFDFPFFFPLEKEVHLH